MKLTQEQIDRLYQFTIQHYVEYYDLQTELVDHLANSIEQQWQDNPKVSFEDALQIEFKKFGIFGFTDLVENRLLALEKKYRKLVLNHLMEFFKIPTIILTFLSCYLVFLTLKNYLELVISLITHLGLPVFFIVLIMAQYRWNKTIKREKKWMFEEMLRNYGYAVAVAPFTLDLVFRFIFPIPPDMFADTISLIVLSVLTVLYILSAYITLRVIPSKAEQYLKETYPEYEISK